ncbi:hypothetical protein B0H63DRAFT_313042 [Podospora didyma]|uniref:DNA replication factor Cdt1 C-terminal domain-containing protein n=1 Tax=Podospora didyma TaxID=330526 RepID=A0AAE0N4T3_9PEZI|nr:hypothetical protein B0H63DRAFT_313042 [Podospora didyma]
MPSAVSRQTRPVRGKLASSKLAVSSIASFTRVSKLQTIGKDLGEKTAALDSRRGPSIEIVLSSRKRKVESDTVTASTAKKLRHEVDDQTPAAIASVTRKKKTVTFAEPEAVNTPPKRHTPSASSARKRQFRADEDDVQQTPTESDSDPSFPEVLFERLNLQSSPTRKRTKTLVAQTQENQLNDDFILPQEVIDLLDLQVAFLKTLSMQHAHNGANTPVDLRNIYPSATQAWGKRRVTLDDIRMCIGVLTWTPVKGGKASSQPPFYLSDYGRGKICIEFKQHIESGPLREQKLNMDFEANLRTLWSGRRDQGTQVFIATLPKAAIEACASAAKAAPLLAKGQRTLEELKNGIVRKQQEKLQAKAAPPAGTPALLNPDGTKMTLLDRIRAKESLQSQSAQGPTPAQLQRRAALQRADEVAAVIGMLCMATGSGQARISFTMAAVLIKLKDSLRNPISQEDGACCVKLLAAEIAPQWLRVVTIGGRENVVVQPAFQPAKAWVQEKATTLLG